MADAHNIKLKQLRGRLGQIAYQFTQVQFSQSPVAEPWAPPVNAYRCQHGFAICLDLAGVVREEVNIHVEPRKVRIDGRRLTPEPKGKDHQTSQIIAMEIDSGEFARELSLPSEIEVDAVRAEYKEGLLWVYLPFRSQS